ncbi:Tetratricopeptide repeat protein [Candidatus Methanoperedenaceae archaeon GB50]|nr:Tetratricopeptide repeat protein [Candidatus Methanoperedenaceae archaeon GB50]CAD7773205.1 MAG: Tetratricopeptide repeat protein [Candidatus Methanoperedenaceae archaeon GB50]
MAPKKKRPKKEREETTPYTTRHSKHNPQPANDQDKTILLQFHKYYSALESLEKAIELKPDDAEVWFNRARLYALKGEREDALADLRRAIELDSSFKERAKKDKDFEALWDDEEFKRLVA